MAILAWLMNYSHYGVDVTDEAFYLTWLADPSLYSYSPYLFGFVYNPLHELFGGEVAPLRQANILISYVLGWFLAEVTLRKHSRDPLPWKARLALSAAIACAALLVVDTWLPTPSYNSLAQQALFIAASGLVLSERAPTRASVAGWLLVAVGGWLAFMAKPSTAAALAVCATAYVLLAGKWNSRLLLATATLAALLVLVSAQVIDGSVAQFTKRLQLGMEYLGYLQGGHSLQNVLRIDTFQLRHGELAILTFVAVLATVAGLAAQHPGFRRYAAFGISAALVLLVVLLAAGAWMPKLDFGSHKDMMIFGVSVAALALAVLLGGGIPKTVRRPDWSLAILFLALPHVYAFGTNNNYWQVAGASGLFWALSGLTVLMRVVDRWTWSALLPLGAGSQLITALIIHAALSNPYRQPQSLYENGSPIEFGRAGSTLVLSEGFADYIREAMSTARAAGFQLGSPMIDLTGQSPGVLYALGAKSIGQPWTIGGYPGSERFAVAGLRHVPCEEIARAWVLFEPDGPRKLDPALLTHFGLEMARDYRMVASWLTAPGAGGYAERRLQVLMQPTRSQGDAVCADKRSGE
ncbi:hypothetical protein WG922_00525 [Ramlibacter sp. AN1015]|uniref:hypothetical protein n=1 Tax=Ramlibacter sp. AN1015 TaxID=3133428 RepID=UPI0030BA41BD